ncbi:MAG TPA: metallophosphoesterase [Opitutaceae bacterium]|nr:metallophosphoesterase [Opitutaceae bacterium]
MSAKPKLIGPGGQLYGETQPSSDEASFRVNNTSSAYYGSPYYVLHKDQVLPIPPPRASAALQLKLDDFVGPQMIAAIRSAGKIVFHSVGDTGAAKVDHQQTVAMALADQASVADAMVRDLAGPNPPAFFFHLGDVVYHFGEAQYYYDQFYEPYRLYDRPIFAIPGNHDGSVFGPTSSAPQNPTLQAFLDNFCAASAGPSPDAGGMVRTAMTQPGVYFTLDAPFVSIIGLYSNVLEGPGVISSQKGAFPTVSDVQLGFLQSELLRLKPLRQAGQRAVIVALHHPPLSVDANHGGSTGSQQDLDTVFQTVGLWPDMVLSGHAHLYQRFTQRVNNSRQQIPYLVSGSGGFAASPPQENVGPAPITVGNDTMEIDPIIKFGYLTITCDGSTLTATFNSPAGNGTVAALDTVSVNLKTGLLATTAPARRKAVRAKRKTIHGKTKAASPRKTRSKIVKKRRN